MTEYALHATTYGESGPWVVFCHGLFGQGKNWTQIAKVLAPSHRVLLLDMPNHGRSPWTTEFSYAEAARMVAAALPPEPVALVGHSMGGKIAMLVALLEPARVERLCVVDVSPVAYSGGTDFAAYIAAMLEVPTDQLQRRAEADQLLMPVVSDPVVRSFLLQNLHRVGDTWRWQPNLEVLGRDLGALTGWPEEEVVGKVFSGQVLWIAGADSDYIKPEYAAAMEALFPTVRKVRIRSCGKANTCCGAEQSVAQELFNSILPSERKLPRRQRRRPIEKVGDSSRLSSQSSSRA